MIKDLEKYIQTNRNQLDVEEPPKFILDNINKELSNQKKNNYGWIWKAASVILLMTSSVLLFLLLENAKQEVITLQNISPEYQQIEKKYIKSIEAISTSINLDEIDKVEYKWLFDELKYLESINDQFREDINQKVNRAKLVSILVDYYEKKLKLLKRLELEINRRNHEKSIDNNS